MAGRELSKGGAGGRGAAPRGKALSSRTRFVAWTMLYSVAVLGLLDHLSQTGVVPQIGEYAAGILALAPVIMTVLVVPTARRVDRDDFVNWTLVGLGMTSIAVGNIIFGTLYLTTGKDPYPGVADVFSLGMYGFLAAAFYAVLYSHRNLSATKRAALIGSAAVVVISVPSYFFVVGPCLLSSAAAWQPLALRVFNTGYLVLDALLLLGPCVALGVLARRLGLGDRSLPMWILLLSAGVLAATDLVFACTCCSGAGRTALVDAGYALSPLLVGVAVLAADDVSRHAGAPRLDREAPSAPEM